MPSSPVTGKKGSGSRSDAFLILRQEYDLADRTAKKVQKFVRLAGVPAINELRYVAHHLVNTIAPTSDDVDGEKELQRAINHCKRATYEASEAGILFAFDRIVEFKEDYRSVIISSVVPDWNEILALCETVTRRIAETREAREDRTPDHKDFEQLFDRLVAICNRLDAARDDMNKLVEHESQQARRFLLTTVLSVLGIVAGVLAAMGAAYLQ